MTNKEERSICNKVVSELNDGTIAHHVLNFRGATEKERSAWQDEHDNSTVVLLGKLNVMVRGRLARLGRFGGGGTCSTCEIVDLDVSRTELFPADDSEERLRWAGWGGCDSFLFVDDEPIIISGSVGYGQSQPTLVTWLAPDGAKRALCYLSVDSEKKASRKTVSSRNQELCRAVRDDKVDAIAWGKPASNSEPIQSASDRWDSRRTASLDVNLDGKEETIALYDFASGAGCGSYNQWLRDDTELERPVDCEESKSQTGTALNEIFCNSGSGPINDAPNKSDWESVTLFQYENKPYILARGREARAEVFSVWGNKQQTWCEYDVIPQYKIDVHYPVESWPAPESSSTTGQSP